MASAWSLPSGTWKGHVESGGFSLLASALGNAPSSSLQREDISRALGGLTSDSSPSAVFPPEFTFDPATGRRLQRGSATGAPWIGPYGTRSAKAESRPVRGLRQTAMPLSLRNQHTRRAEDDADLKLKLPPAGHYEFFSVPAGTIAPALLAIDPGKGQVYTWLNGSDRWAPMDHTGGGVLVETRIPRLDWRAEAVIETFSTRLFLPTENGLACVAPDALGLSFHVEYHGGARAVASPVQFGDRIWAPLKTAKGTITFAGIDLGGTDLLRVELRNGVLDNLGRIASPVATPTAVIWACEKGQLQLVKTHAGAFEGNFEPWPEFIEPALQFGSPYLSSDGRLWQVCLDTRSSTFVYGLLGRGTWEMREAQSPRLSAGQFNFRFATRQGTAPWIEPEHGDDSSTDSVVVPIMESVDNATVLGLKFKSTKGIESVLRETDRTRVVLIVDDEDTQTEFGSLAVPDPLHLRFFVHDAHLWVYHADHLRLEGWALSS